MAHGWGAHYGYVHKFREKSTEIVNTISLARIASNARIDFTHSRLLLRGREAISVEKSRYDLPTEPQPRPFLVS